MRIPFSKQYQYITNYLHLYVTNYYIFFCTIIHLLLTMCLALFSHNISWNSTFMTVIIFGQISICPMDLFFLQVNKVVLYLQHGFFRYEENVLYNITTLLMTLVLYMFCFVQGNWTEQDMMCVRCNGMLMTVADPRTIHKGFTICHGYKQPFHNATQHV